MSNFGRTLNFTSANEDGATELAALALGPGDHVLCLTASGARPLDLLLAGPARITSIDSNPAQNELLRLKMAAYRVLDDDALYAFLGLAPSGRRGDLFAEVSRALPPSSRAFWGARMGAVRSGIWHAGRWERVLRIGAFGNRALRGAAIDTLFDAPTLEAQAGVWRRRFDDAVWHGAVRLLSRRWFWTHIVGEPGGAFLPPPAESEARLTDLFRRASASFFFRDSDFATLLFRGRHTTTGALPLHLQRANLDTVRSRLDRIVIADQDLASLDRSGLGPFDAFSLSDFGSYCGQEAYDACWAGVLATAAPGARYCERVFMNPVTPGPSIAARLAPDTDRSAALTFSDRAIIYDIRCGALLPGK